MLEARFTSRRGQFALDLEFTAVSDEILAVVGPNGAGKTSLLRVLAGLDPITDGELRVDGLAWEDSAAGLRLRPEQRRIGYVPQAGLLFPHLSVLDNVAFGLESSQPERATEILDRLGMTGLAGSMPGELSGGQAQLVALARAQARRPTVLLLDEPLASVDVANRAATRRLLRRELREQPGYRILVTHDPLEAAALADRIMVLDAGTITQIGTVDELSTRPRSRYVADLVGINFFTGRAAGGSIALANGATLVGSSMPDGPAIATVHPRSVALYRDRPSGSPRNVWAGTIASLEPSLDQVRVHVTGPIDIIAQVTHEGATGFTEGTPVWVSVKASEVMGYPR